MPQLLSDQKLEDWIELIALLMSSSGILVVGASLIASGFASISISCGLVRFQSRQIAWCSTIFRRGVGYLACGGGFFAIAELMEALNI